MANPISVTNASLTVAENSLATSIGLVAPTDTLFPISALTVSITSLPTDGILLLADGVTPVTIGETLTVAQLTGLKFRPAFDGFSATSSFTFSVADPAGNTATGAATLAIGASNTPIVTTWTSFAEAANGPATTIGIAAPTDASPNATLTIKLTALPKDGTVLLSTGAAVSVGQTLTIAQLTGLQFLPSTTNSAQESTLAYSVTDSAGHTATGSVLLAVTPDRAPTVPAASLTVAENSGPTPIGIAAPYDANFAASQLSAKVTGLPTDGSVFLADGTTAVTLGQSLSVAQLAGLEFAPTTGVFGQSSSFSYTVSDPSGASTNGTATLSVGPQNAALTTTPVSLTVPANSPATPVGIQAPSDANFAASQLSVQVTALPTDGTVLNGTSAVTLGQSLSVAQLTGLTFTPIRDNTGQSSSFSYTVSDPAGKTATGSATLATGPNRIVLENEKQGTPESVWQIPTDSTNIEGFTTNISVNLGQALNFKINTDSAHYRIDIYRLGYYGGDGARLVTSIDHNAASAINQPNPIVDPTTGLVDAGNWSVTDTWNVPTDVTSGVYVANLIREDGTAGAFQVPFIVRDDSSHSDIVFQTDDETWQAYNGWGGANLYGGNGPAPAVQLSGNTEVAAGAAFAVSYNRPIMTRDGVGTFAGPQDMVFGAEYPAIQWLEQNGYDVSYISGIDTATNGALLLNHKVFMDAGHDEYWTDSQQANVQAAAKAGVSLAFLSGNEMFWQTRLAPSIDGSGANNRTLVAYKDTHFNHVVDPTGTATGSFLDPRFGPVTPTNAVTGTYFQADANRADTISIPFDMTQLRLWRNTSVANTAPGQTASLVPGILGYEWDSSPDNGFRPAGLVDLSSTTLQINSDVSNFGDAEGTGTATHNLVEFRDPTSGALVFGAGTVFWSWGLSSDHDPTKDGLLTDGNVPVDSNVEQATVNFLADMGVQPESLQASLVIANQSTDHTPPKTTISSVSATNVVEGQTITVTGTSTDAGGGVIGGVEVSTDGGKTWHPANSPVGTASVNWTYSFTAPTPGTYTIEARAVDDSINLETAGPGVSYTVTPSSNLTLLGNSTPGTVTVSDPQAVNLGMKFTAATPGLITGFRFYKGPQNTGTHVASLWTTSGTLLAQATFTNETASGWQQVNLSSPVKTTAGTTYIVSYHSTGNYSATDGFFTNVNDAYVGVSNGSLTAPTAGTNGLFTYGSASVMPTTISGANYFVDVVFSDTVNQPQANDYAVTDPANTTLTIQASTLLALDSDPHGLPLSITGVGNAVNGTVSFNSTTQTITFVPTANFTGPATFTYSIADTGNQSASGNVSVAVNHPISAQSLFNSGDTPTTVTVNDPQSVELGVKFQASATGLVTGIRFYKGPQNTGAHTGELWSASGNLLATVTFTNETASGWQEADFSNPVLITAGTTYVASYHTTSGNYSADANYFANPHTNQELTALANATSADGVFAYGNGLLFPSNSGNGTNYWVDLVFNGTPDLAVANADSGFSTAANTTLAINAASLLANDIDTAGNPLSITGVGNAVNGSVSYNAVSQTVSFTPTAGYVGAASFTYSVADGQGATASGNVSLAVNYPVSAQSLFFPTDTPATITVNDANSVELGVKFQAATSGAITGIRFYKGPQNTGTHTGELWSSNGTLLATATFTNETASGWQEVDFSSPVMITAGTTYVASYHTTSGDYSASGNYFATAHTNGGLTALASGASGGDGLFAYGSGPLFPSNNFNATNYWVDVVFNGSSNIAVANPDSGFTTNENTSLSIASSALLANDTDTGGFPLSITGVSKATNGGVSYDPTAQTVTFTPTAGYTGPAGFTYSITDGHGGNASTTVSLTVNAPVTAQTLFNTSTTPNNVTINDPSAVELGVKFEASTDGTITGIRFYKGPQNTGPHTADLWTASGTLLASATFTNETASGWQEADFSTPVSISANTIYVAAYHTNGNYSGDGGFFSSALTNQSLTAPSSASSGGNGVYAYGSSDLFPSNSFNSTNYYVDPVFKPHLVA